jgi:uroporphyrinogen III methyltransferase/synthase
VDFQPEEEVAEALAAGLPGPLDRARILIPRAEEARDALPEGLRARGALVDVLHVYRTLPADPPEAETTAEMLSNGEIHLLTFTSSSTVRNFVRLFGTDWLGPLSASGKRPIVACIGPITAETARACGLPVDVVPSEGYTVPSLVKAVADYVAACAPRPDTQV